MSDARGGNEGCSGRCPACGWPAATIWVHGHGQCARCGQVVAPCCQPEPASSGETAERTPEA